MTATHELGNPRLSAVCGRTNRRRREALPLPSRRAGQGGMIRADRLRAGERLLRDTFPLHVDSNHQAGAADEHHRKEPVDEISDGR